MVTGFIGFLVGICLGSFTKATSDRMVESKSLRGRSYCPGCHQTLRWYDLIPIFSYLSLKGRCRYCREKITIDYLLVELVVGALVALVFITTLPDSPQLLFQSGFDAVLVLLDLLFKTFFVTILAIVFLIDLRSGYIFDRVIFPATFITGLYLVITNLIKSWWLYQNLLSSPIGKYLLPPHSGYFMSQLGQIWTPVLWALAAGVAVSLVFVLLILITKGKGMGWGDVKYVFLLGLALGFPNILVAILLAFFTGALFSIALIIFRKKHFGQTIPFGPFLSLGAILALFWGTQILNWYLNYIS